MFAGTLHCIAFWCLLARSAITSSSHPQSHRLHSRQAIIRPEALRNFEVREPPVVPESEPCHQVLLQHTFANSYGHPANAQYSPPKDCGDPGSWASVTFNLTGTSIGNQYDRLGRLYLNDIEVWRTSTAEPTKTGIVWTVVRDVTKYIPLLSSPGSLSLEINNIVDKAINLTGNFEVTLSAKFYPPTPKFPASKKADKIVNMGRGTGNNMTTLLTFPQNLESAFVELFASGAGQEEFWYTNAPDEYIKKIDPNNTGVAYGKGPFREVQVWIDDSLAGVAYPFPVIYTGGILLLWWRPIAAIGAFDSPTYIIDISPFIPYLSDSQQHNFTLTVEGQGERHAINSEWIFSGSVFMSLDPSGARTTGKIVDYFVDSQTSVDPKPKTLSGAPRKNSKSVESFISFGVRSFRKLSVCSTLVTGSGVTRTVKFEQNFNYTNQQSWLPLGNYQSVLMSSQGTSRSTRGNTTYILDRFDFPLNLTTSVVPVPELSASKIFGNLTHSYKRSQSIPLSSGLGQIDIDTTQISTGELSLNSHGRAIKGIGRTSQAFEYKDGTGQAYTRNVEIFNVTHVIRDEESGTRSLSATDGYESMNSLAAVDSIHGSPLRTLRMAQPVF